MILDIFIYILTLPVKLYVITWTYLLLLFKRRVPKWLQERTKEEINWQPSVKPEKYNR